MNCMWKGSINIEFDNLRGVKVSLGCKILLAVRQNFSFGLLFSLRADCCLEWHSKCLAFWATNKLLVTNLFLCIVGLVFFLLTLSIFFYQSYSKRWQEGPIKLSMKSYFLKHIKKCIILYEPWNTACSWGNWTLWFRQWFT